MTTAGQQHECLIIYEVPSDHDLVQFFPCDAASALQKETLRPTELGNFLKATQLMGEPECKPEALNTGSCVVLSPDGGVEPWPY